MEKNLTAVEWLVEQYKKVGGISISMAEIAKEMEREQIVEAFGDGAMDTLKLGKEYYNYLYKKQ